MTGLFCPTLPRAARTRAPDDTLSLLFVGRGVPNKAQDHLILAVHALLESGRDARLTLVGSWDGSVRFEEHCRTLAERLQIGSHVTFAGSVSDDELAGHYANADVFVCLSDHEGFCAPLIEAMHADLPIVAYAAGAVPWTVGGAGLVLTDKRPSMVAEAIAEVVSNPRLQARFAANRERQTTYHAPEAVGRRVLESVERVR
ncbi:MAG: glycosyltransferase [Thermoleophilia bacterium]